MLYTLVGSDESSYAELDAGYAHSLPLPGLDEVRGTYYPDLDALYVGAEGFDPEKISYRSPSFVNEERILEGVDQSREELTVADLVAYVRTDDAVTFQHEFGHYYLSTFSAAYSQPLYTGMEANRHLHSSITHGELSRNALQSLFALEIRNMLYTHRTRPVQEVFAWVAQAVFDDRSAQEALANRISEIDTELSSLGYTFTHPGYNPLVYESREKTAEWEHFRLSYECALLSAAHRIFREIPEQPAFQLIRAAAKTALTASFSLIQSRRDQESSEVYTAAGRANLEPAATFASVLTKYLNDIYEFQVLIDDGISMESVTAAIIEVSSTGIRGLESAVEFFEGQLSEEVYEIYGDDVMNKLLAALKRNSLPTLLFIEEPNEGNIRVFINERGLPLDYLSLSLAKKMIIIGARTETNPFVENPFSVVLNFIFEQGPSPEAFHVEDSFTDTLATMFDSINDGDIVADWENIVTEFREFDSGIGVMGVLQEGSQESASSSETTYHRESLDRALRKLCEYRYEGEPTQLDSYFNADPSQGNITVSQFFGGMATVIPRSPEAEPDGKKIYQFDKVIRDIATEREECLTFYSEVYGHAMAMICFYSDGNHLNGDATEWIQRFTYVVASLNHKTASG